MRKGLVVADQDDPVLDVQAASDLAGIHPMGVRRAIKSRALPAWRTKPRTGHFRTRKSHVLEWMDTLRVDTEQPIVATAGAA